MEDILAETGHRYSAARDKLSSGYMDYRPAPSRYSENPRAAVQLPKTGSV